MTDEQIAQADRNALTDDIVWDALDAYESEFKAWRIVPDLYSRYNDRNGATRFRHSWVTNDMQETAMYNPVSAVPETSSFKRIHLKTETAKKYITWQAMKAALNAALKGETK
jgi:hypothetical protein